MKLLVDECLSPELTKRARAMGLGEADHVTWIGLSGAKDWQLKPVILNGDWVFVTRNSIDFRGPESDPGSKGEYAGVELHAGLICLNGPAGMDLEMQVEMFEIALAEIQANPDMVNTVLEISVHDALDSDIEVVRYLMPS